MSDSPSALTESSTAQPCAASVPFESRPRFTLAELLLWTTGISVSLAAVYWLGCFGFAIAMLMAIAYVPWRLGLCRFWESAVVAAALAVILMAFLPTVRFSQAAAKHSMCCGHFKQLSLALHNYHDTYGSFPPAYIADAQGTPMHSWRVLILPFIEESKLYEQYRFDQPWDGPNNRKLHSQMPRTFSCPSDASRLEGTTAYVAVIGTHTVWPGETCVSFNQVLDGTAASLLLVEVHDSGIHWMEPRDLHVSQMAPTINSERGQGISSGHTNGANAALVDASLIFLPENYPADQLRKLLTIDDGAVVTIP